MNAPEITVQGGRLFGALPAGLRGSVGAALLLSAAVHAGAIAWGLSGAAERTMAIDAGAATVIEVSLVEGPADGAAGAGGAPPSRPVPIATADAQAARTAPLPEAPAVETRAERAVSADRLPPPTVASAASASTLPPAPEAAPVPPPKPSPPADAAVERPGTAGPATPVQDAPQFAALPTAGPFGRPAMDKAWSDATSVAASGGAPGATGGGTEGAAPHADNPAPDYPLAARQRGQEGRVVLSVEVLPSGDAGAVTVERSSGVASLDDAAVEAVRRWRFRPAQRNGTTIRATVQVPIRFALK
jgi:periplasmic protein TonB